MDGLLSSLTPLLQKYRAELILLSISLIIALFSGVIFLKSLPSQEEKQIKVASVNQTIDPGRKQESKILVDLSGAVENPDVYEISSGARLKDVLIMAGGLSSDANRGFFAKNFNLARTLADQEKIYIPTVEDFESGNVQITQDQIVGQVAGTTTSNSQSKISLNSASMQELDTLPGVGKVTAQKIIQNRPFTRLEELTDRKITNKATFEKIKDLISL